MQYFSLINNTTQVESIDFLSTNGADFKIYEILSSISKNKANIKDALRLLRNNKIEIGPNENKYFVIQTFQERNSENCIEIRKSDNTQLIGKFDTSVSQSRKLRKEDKLEANVWAYLDKPVLKDNKATVVNDLEESGVDVIVVHSSFLNGESLTDLSKLKNYLKNFRNLGEKKIMLFYNFKSSPTKRFNGKTFLDNTWKINFSKWYRALQSELSSIGVNTNEIYFYPYDEIKPNEVGNFIEIAKWGKANIPHFKTFITISDEKSYGAGGYADIVQLFKPHLNRIQKINNKNVWIYTTSNQTRDLDPYGYYRLMSWEAYYYGLKGVGFWNYCSVPSEEVAYYNRVANGNNEYSVIYLDENKEVIPSLRWLCFQQGLKDHQVLKAYERFLGKDKIRKIVKNVIDNPNDSERADEALRALSEIM